jgi:hypothetical protein
MKRLLALSSSAYCFMYYNLQLSLFNGFSSVIRRKKIKKSIGTDKSLTHLDIRIYTGNKYSRTTGSLLFVMTFASRILFVFLLKIKSN